MHSQYDKIVYINLAQDQVTAVIDTLTIHEKAVELIKIPEGINLGDMQDESQFPENITNYSKIYFSAHGREGLDHCVLDKRTGEAHIYELDEVAAYFGRILKSHVFKNPDTKPRLTLVMSVCEGVGLARNLQNELFKKYGLYIDVVANKNVVGEQYMRTKKNTNPTHRTTAKGLGRDHLRLHDKVLLTIDKYGTQKEIDAYELKWIDNVLNTIHKQVAGFRKWADFSKPENIQILKGLTNLCTDIDAIIVTFVEEDISLTANNLLALLRICGKTTADSYYKDAMKYKSLTMTIPSLIQQGVKSINYNQNMQNMFTELDQIELQKNAAVRGEVAQNILKLKKADISTLLLEVSENGMEGVLSKIEKA
ncbi:hypothetical protein TUM19329_09610 [Legionella antarctica]|uniref:Uncharacterized protein n=1 Tax=Legionella antarctica TaxID=2708020 RepID=A0A6F8T363_9GAMM|nr:hypothetical protein [Legionella antarctica]BCA94600.1 hypothetical protein TUM19329_09610 [Legionella antarctica]